MIKPDFKMQDLRKYILQQVEQREKALVETYRFVGERFVIYARSKTAANGGFRDVTGNLRSSIGYIIAKDGVMVYRGFETANAGTEKSKGKQVGETFATKIVSKYPKGIILIVVAGMDYAAAVESRGKDVITGSSLGIQDQLTTLLKAA